MGPTPILEMTRASGLHPRLWLLMSYKGHCKNQKENDILLKSSFCYILCNQTVEITTSTWNVSPAVLCSKLSNVNINQAVIQSLTQFFENIYKLGLLDFPSGSYGSSHG